MVEDLSLGVPSLVKHMMDFENRNFGELMARLVGLGVGFENGSLSGFGNGNGKSITIPIFGCHMGLDGNEMALATSYSS